MYWFILKGHYLEYFIFDRGDNLSIKLELFVSINYGCCPMIR